RDSRTRRGNMRAGSRAIHQMVSTELIIPPESAGGRRLTEGLRDEADAAASDQRLNFLISARTVQGEAAPSFVGVQAREHDLAFGLLAQPQASLVHDHVRVEAVALQHPPPPLHDPPPPPPRPALLLPS